MSKKLRGLWPWLALLGIWALFFWRFAAPEADRVTYPAGDHALSADEGGIPEILAWFNKHIGRPEQESSSTERKQRIAEVVRAWPKTTATYFRIVPLCISSSLSR